MAKNCSAPGSLPRIYLVSTGSASCPWCGCWLATAMLSIQDCPVQISYPLASRWRFHINSCYILENITHFNEHILFNNNASEELSILPVRWWNQCHNIKKSFQYDLMKEFNLASNLYNKRDSHLWSPTTKKTKMVKHLINLF